MQLRLCDQIHLKSSSKKSASISLFIKLRDANAILTIGNIFTKGDPVCFKDDLIGFVEAVWVGKCRDFALISLMSHVTWENSIVLKGKLWPVICQDILTSDIEEDFFWTFRDGENVYRPSVTFSPKLFDGTSSTGRPTKRKYEVSCQSYYLYQPFMNGSLLMSFKADRVFVHGILWGHNWPQLLFEPIELLFDTVAREKVGKIWSGPETQILPDKESDEDDVEVSRKPSLWTRIVSFPAISERP